MADRPGLTEAAAGGFEPRAAPTRALASPGFARRSLANLARSTAGCASALALALALLMLVGTSQHLANRFLEETQGQSAVPLAERRALSVEVLTYLSAPENALIVHPGLSYRERAYFREVKRLLRAGTWALAAMPVLVACLLVLCRRLDPPQASPVALLASLLGSAGFVLVLLTALLATQLNRFDAGFAASHWLLLDGTLWLLPADSLTARCFPPSTFHTLATWYGSCVGVLAVGLACAGRWLAVRTPRR